MRFVANKKGIKISPLIREFIKQGLSEHLPDAETLGLSPTASFYDSVAFAIAVLIQQGLDLPKQKQDVVTRIHKDILHQMGVTNETDTRL